METAEEEIRDFYGVYLLCSRSEMAKFAGKVYIGYTVNPNRRINQHNRGCGHGGARKTSNRGPWTMVMIVHGFPNSITALRFEWAWQKPRESRRLRSIAEIQRKKTTESHFEYNFRILAEMLRTEPWNRLPLTIRWLSNEFIQTFPTGKTPPVHMDIAYGSVRVVRSSKRAVASQIEQLERLRSTQRSLDCGICTLRIGPSNASVSCMFTNCARVFHMVCLASVWLEPGQFVPVRGDCPGCKAELLWGQLIRQANGCADVERGGCAADCGAAAAVTWSDVEEDEDDGGGD